VVPLEEGREEGEEVWEEGREGREDSEDWEERGEDSGVEGNTAEEEVMKERKEEEPPEMTDLESLPLERDLFLSPEDLVLLFARTPWMSFDRALSRSSALVFVPPPLPLDFPLPSLLSST